MEVGSRRLLFVVFDETHRWTDYCDRTDREWDFFRRPVVVAGPVVEVVVENCSEDWGYLRYRSVEV